MGSFTKIAGHGMVLDTAVLDRMTVQMKPRARAIIEKYGLAVTGDAAMRAPFEFGALRNSITSESKMTGDMTFTVSDGVTYGIYQEFGTSKMRARPFMRPAIEAWKQRFQDAFKGLFT